MRTIPVLALSFVGLLAEGTDVTWGGGLVGVTVTPHRIESTLRYRRPHGVELAARVQLFVRGPAASPTFAGRSPDELVGDEQWAWHDVHAAAPVPEGALSVWTFNGRASRWGCGEVFQLQAEGLPARDVPLATPTRWISAITFLGEEEQNVRPDTVIVHIANEADQELRVTSLRLWLPQSGATWQTLWPQPSIPVETTVPARDKGFLRLRVEPLPLTYAAVELMTDAGPLWAHVRIKRETFDISGGWIFDSERQWAELVTPNGGNAFLDVLCHMHVNTGHFETVAGYTDDPTLYARYPLKRFHRLWPLSQWDTDELLPTIHAVEFLGEPQYGGGRPVPSQEVFDQLLPYRTSRLATTVTHSEERIWRFYAGLSDYPHFDAYRVVAPAADAWSQYDRWGGRRISWGAPLETIGDLCRSQRELNRPMPCAVWSQGPHHGWGGGWGGGLLRAGRARRSPTPDELRSQAVHALATRVTSLYWFNLSLPSLRKYPDTWEAMTRVGREIRMLAPFYLEGDAYHFQRRTTAEGTPDWDLASIAAPQAAVLFAIDTAYTPDPEENVFVFGPPRPATFQFPLPPWLRQPADVFRVDADGVYDVRWSLAGTGITIDGEGSRDCIYVAAKSEDVRVQVEQRRALALVHEAAYPAALP